MTIEIENTVVKAAVARAEGWQNRANELLTHEEKDIQEQMLRLVTHPMDKVALTQLIDQSFRSDNARRVADQILYLLKKNGVPDFFNTMDRLLVQMFKGVGRHLPWLTIPKVIDKMRQQSSRAIIAGEPEALHAHLRRRKEQGVRMNINHLGEAVLGEAEARSRLETYLGDLANPEVEYMSVKISTIYSQITAIAFEQSVAILKERLSKLYRAARDHRFTRKDGSQVPKFVNLDMEEYRDLDITAEAFRRTLDDPEFRNHSAGIVLQAYLPDSFSMQQSLTRWARKRVTEGGAAIKIRIVKGANMEMEMVEAALKGWALAPYDNKLEVDANYKRMVHYGMAPENIRAVHLGIGSHNLFELAYAYELARKNGVTRFFSFEMLEGMADHVRRALRETDEELVLYAPVAGREQFINAIGYLIRRLDENTAPENFLRHSFHLKTTDPAWRFLEKQFLQSCRAMETAGTRPHRNQDRSTEAFPEDTGTFVAHTFINEPDTDMSLAENRRWADAIRRQWRKNPGDPAMEIPVVVAGEDRFGGHEVRESLDLSAGNAPVVIARYALATQADIAAAAATAKADPDGWRKTRQNERHAVLSRVAVELRRARADLIGVAMAEGGKVFAEADGEVSEAIDFTEFYPHSARTFTERAHLKAHPMGVGLVISPWNFPIAIPCGGIVASLAAGNTVLFKPASATVATAWELVKAFYRAGVSKNTLQFLPCSGAEAGAKLTGHPDVDFIILTGGTDTGMRILEKRPGVFLAAETGGKNATIVTAMSDRDQAIADVLHSAFGHGGQKCSATSLLLLEEEIYDDPSFKKQLLDAARSWAVGPVWEFNNRMGPLIAPPAGDLERGMTTLEPGETWALQPRQSAENPRLWTPGIKYGGRPGDFTHMTELFGPVLSVMPFKTLKEAIDIVNRTGYGLTSGLESLDEREQEIWKREIRAGNLYINRGTTGAIVLRQPFGGMGKSALGAGIKAGGPNYVAQFMKFEELGPPRTGAVLKDSGLLRLSQEWRRGVAWGKFGENGPQINKTIHAIRSLLYHAEREFGVEKDYFHLRGQDNIVRYLPVGTVMVRIHPDDTLFETLARIAAVRVSGCELVASAPPELSNGVTAFLEGREGKKLRKDLPVLRQTDAEVIRSLTTIDRIRYAAPGRVPAEIFGKAAQTGFYIARSPVMMDGRIELLHYYREQAVCFNYHRYGNLGARALL